MRIGENIYKRKDGRWEARTAVGRKKSGKLAYLSFYGRTCREAKKKKLDYETRIPVRFFQGKRVKILRSACFALCGSQKEKNTGNTAPVSVIKTV